LTKVPSYVILNIEPIKANQSKDWGILETLGIVPLWWNSKAYRPKSVNAVEKGTCQRQMMLSGSQKNTQALLEMVAGLPKYRRC